MHVNRGYQLLRDKLKIDLQSLTPYSLSKVVNEKPPRKRTLYAQCALKLRERSYLADDTQIKMFVKWERMEDPTKAPRAIQARKPYYNLQLQQYIKPIERLLFHTGYEKRFTTKNLDDTQKAHFLRYLYDQHPDCKIFLADHSRYDSRQNTHYLKNEHSIYVDLFDGDATLSHMLSKQIKNNGKSKHIEYKVTGTRMSGEATTSLGNSLSNYAVLLDITRDRNASICCDGDDSVVFHDGQEFTEAELSVYRLGTKVEYANSFEELSFCQCNPVMIDGTWRMIRTPSRVIERTSTCIDKAYNKDIDNILRWYHTVGTGELIRNLGVPILQNYALFLRRLHTRQIGLSSEYTYVYEQRSPIRISDESRLSFQRAFGYTKTQQIDIENYFDTITVNSGRVQSKI